MDFPQIANKTPFPAHGISGAWLNVPPRAACERSSGRDGLGLMPSQSPQRKDCHV
jgi:hypothetical protein